MAIYDITNEQSSLSAVEFTPVSDGNFAFLTVKAGQSPASVKEWLQAADVGQQVVAETKMGDETILVTKGKKTKEEMITALEAHGETVKPHQHKKNFSDIAWPVRGKLGFAGQSLQLGSSFLTKKGFAWDTGMFAALNLAANAMAIAFGAQKRPDEHKLLAIKSDINDRLSDSLAEGKQLPDVNEDYLSARKEAEPKKSAWEKSKKWVADNSVVLGEVGLRFAGGLAVAFPINKWLFKATPGAKTTLNHEWLKLVGSGSLKEAYLAARNDAMITHYAGLGSLSGKLIALGSQAEDPYNPKPKTWVDNVREKVLFKLGGNIEAVSFGAQTYDNFTNKSPSKQISFLGKDSPNYIAGVGSGLFTAGYIVRNWAKFGVKEFDHEEMHAHATEALARTAPEKLPQLLADTAATLKSHFKDDKVGYGEIYTHMANDLYHYHHIAVNTDQPTFDESPPSQREFTPGKYTQANPSRRNDNRMPSATSSFVEKAAQASDLQSSAAVGV